MEVFVARQPIFNDKEETFGYELLYRSNQRNVFPNINGDLATADVIINSFLNIGIDQLSDGKPCFINFTERLLQLKLPTYFRPREIIVEILESVEPTAELIELCKELKNLGYRIALDDYVLNHENPFSYELLRTSDIIKVDFMTTPTDKRLQIELIAKTLKIELLAEKVETREEFESAKQLGYKYFQGYFFSKPVVVSTYDVPTYFHSYYQVIQKLSMTEPSIDKITELIEQDLSLSYKLLKLINSPAYRPKHRINSIRQAIVLLGLIEIQKWIYVLAVRETTGAVKHISRETVRICLTRAKMSESVAKIKKKNQPSSGYFLTGMFSLMDAVLGIPMEKLLKDLPLHEDIINALKGNDNELRKVLDLVIDVEKGDWEKISSLCESIHIDEVDVFEAYAEAVKWANQLVKDELTKS